MATELEFKEQYRLTLSNEGKIRNRAEAYLVAYAQGLLADPVPYAIDAVHLNLQLELNKINREHPSWGTCRLSDIHAYARVIGTQRVTRCFAIYGRGRGIYTLSIKETIEKDGANGFAPYIRLATPTIQEGDAQ